MPLPNIDCKECGHVNEGERVYCHNCGGKLDRSVLATAKQEQESIEQRQRRVRKMMNPDTGLGRFWWRTALKTIGSAAIAAALIDMALPPDGVPPMPKRGEPPENLQLDIALENLSIAPSGTKVVFKQDEINAYLKNKIRLKYDGNVFQSISTYQRSFVQLDNGVIRILMQNAVADYPLYFGVGVQLTMGSAKDDQGVSVPAITGTPTEARIGRLWLPGIVAEYGGPIFAPLWESLRRERRLIDQLDAVEVRKGEVIFTARGRSRNNPDHSNAAVPPVPSRPPLGSSSSLGRPALGASTLGNPSLRSPSLSASTSLRK